MEKCILDFIGVFQSYRSEELFSDCACYWFSHILHTRFIPSEIVYDASNSHFATKISNLGIYDIKGKVENEEDYESWSVYKKRETDADIIKRYCIDLMM